MSELNKEKEIKIAVAGLGGAAKRMHLPVLKKIPTVKVVAGAEKDSYQRERVKNLFQIPYVFESFQEMYESDLELDAVYICLPPALHYEAVKKALERNWHVFCEKPMGLSAEKAEELVRIAKERKLVLMPGYNMRFIDNYQKAKKIVEEGLLGEIVQVQAIFVNPGPYIGWDPKSDWYLEDESHGVLYDTGSHIIDLLYFISKMKISEVYAISHSGFKGFKIPTNLACVFSMENETSRAVGTLDLGWRDTIELCSIQVHGTAGSITVSRNFFDYSHGSTDPAERIKNHLRNAWLETKRVINRIKGIGSGLDVRSEFMEESKTFIKAVQGDEKILSSVITPEEAVLTLRILDAISLSLTSGVKVQVEY